jgi:lantibiotic modifying enzyme
VARLGLLATSTLATDIERALAAVENGWVHQTHDTLCCGTLGTIEFLTEAQTALGRCELGELARQRLIHVVSTAAVRGDYRWIAGRRQFNPGLFRGLAGVGYSILRQLDPTLPNVLLWD